MSNIKNNESTTIQTVVPKFEFEHSLLHAFGATEDLTAQKYDEIFKGIEEENDIEIKYLNKCKMITIYLGILGFVLVPAGVILTGEALMPFLSKHINDNIVRFIAFVIGACCGGIEPFIIRGEVRGINEEIDSIYEDENDLKDELDKEVKLLCKGR